MKLIVLVALMMLTGISYSQDFNPIPIPKDTVYIINGMPEPTAQFHKINFDDISSFSILKDDNVPACMSCRNDDRIIIVITTIKALTKRERRKHEKKKKKLQIP